MAIHATSINGGYDVDMRDRRPGQGRDLTGGIPFADGAGEVVALGADVTRFKVGDRVAGIFMERWLDGDRTEEGLDSSRGGNAGGMLSEMIVSNEQSLVAIPKHLTYEEAATLPTAGVTAWVSLFKYGGLEAGHYVLLEGTGGVSTFGLDLRGGRRRKAHHHELERREARARTRVSERSARSTTARIPIGKRRYASSRAARE